MAREFITEEECLDAVKRDGRNLKYCKVKTEEICKRAIDSSEWAVAYLPEEFKTKEMMEEYVRRWERYCIISYMNYMTEDMALTIVEKDNCTYWHHPGYDTPCLEHLLKTFPEVVTQRVAEAAVKATPWCAYMVKDKISQEFVNEWCLSDWSGDGKSQLNAEVFKRVTDKNILYEVCKSDPWKIKYIDKKYDEVIIKILSKDLSVIKYVPETKNTVKFIYENYNDIVNNKKNDSSIQIPRFAYSNYLREVVLLSNQDLLIKEIKLVDSLSKICDKCYAPSSKDSIERETEEYRELVRDSHPNLYKLITTKEYYSKFSKELLLAILSTWKVKKIIDCKSYGRLLFSKDSKYFNKLSPDDQIEERLLQALKNGLNSLEGINPDIINQEVLEYLSEKGVCDKTTIEIVCKSPLSTEGKIKCILNSTNEKRDLSFIIKAMEHLYFDYAESNHDQQTEDFENKVKELNLIVREVLTQVKALESDFEITSLYDEMKKLNAQETLIDISWEHPMYLRWIYLSDKDVVTPEMANHGVKHEPKLLSTINVDLVDQEIVDNACLQDIKYVEHNKSPSYEVVLKACETKYLEHVGKFITSKEQALVAVSCEIWDADYERFIRQLEYIPSEFKTTDILVEWVVHNYDVNNFERYLNADMISKEYKEILLSARPENKEEVLKALDKLGIDDKDINELIPESMTYEEMKHKAEAIKVYLKKNSDEFYRLRNQDLKIREKLANYILEVNPKEINKLVEMDKRLLLLLVGDVSSDVYKELRSELQNEFRESWTHVVLEEINLVAKETGLFKPVGVNNVSSLIRNNTSSMVYYKTEVKPFKVTDYEYKYNAKYMSLGFANHYTNIYFLDAEYFGKEFNDNGRYEIAALDNKRGVLLCCTGVYFRQLREYTLLVTKDAMREFLGESFEVDKELLVILPDQKAVVVSENFIFLCEGYNRSLKDELSRAKSKIIGEDVNNIEKDRCPKCKSKLLSTGKCSNPLCK